jgi:short-subunit dehydrogenase
VLAVPCDVTRPVQVEAMVDEVVRRWGRIDVLVNNAGTISVGPIETMSLDDYRQAMDVHFWAAVYTIRAVLPYMRRQRDGRIVNIASIGGKLSLPHLVPYSASKFALVGLSEGLRSELAEDGILVTTVCPGLMRTGSPRHAFFKGRHRAEYAWFKISDSLPLFSMSAERAARQIIAACEAGEAEVVLSWPAKLAVMFHDLFPAWTADILAALNHVLPGPGGRATSAVEGKESESFWTDSWLTGLSNRAARANNEIAPEERRRRPPPNGAKPPNN